MLDRGSQVKSVESREMMICTDPRGSFPNRGRNRQHSGAGAGKECRLTRQIGGVSGLERPN